MAPTLAHTHFPRSLKVHWNTPSFGPSGIHWPISIVLGFDHCKQWARTSVLTLSLGQTPRDGLVGPNVKNFLIFNLKIMLPNVCPEGPTFLSPFRRVVITEILLDNNSAWTRGPGATLGVGAVLGAGGRNRPSCPRGPPAGVGALQQHLPGAPAAHGPATSGKRPAHRAARPLLPELSSSWGCGLPADLQAALWTPGVIPGFSELSHKRFS